MAPLIAIPPTYHWLPEAALDVNVTEPPEQKVVTPPAVIVGVGGVGFTIITFPVEGAEAQPFVVTTTV